MNKLLPFILLLVVCGCSGGSAGDDTAADAGPPPRLEIVAPGDSIGLAPDETVELRVRYVTDDGAALDGAPVTFSLVAGDAGSGGSALSAATVPTDGAGEAAVTFLAGAERVDLRVIADAPNAEATFYINVSSGGFATLDVTPSYQGGRDLAELGVVELRLYRAATVTCAAVDVDAPPDSPMAPRTLAAWDLTASWPSVAASESYTLLVWGVHAVSGAAVSVVCVDVPASAVPSTHAELAVTVPDRAIVLPAQPLASELSLAHLDASIEAAGAHRPWRILGCPVGRGQLVLDWVVDALSADGALDGVTTTPTGLGATMTAERGTLGAGGCRAGGASLDATIDAAIEAGDFPGGANLALLLARRGDVLRTVQVTSEIEPLGPTQLRHRLVTAAVDATGAPTFTLADTDRPVLVATAITTAPVPGALGVADHGFTLRTGTLLRDSLDAAALVPIGLGGDSAALGAGLIESAEDGALTGCDAVSKLACTAASAATTCAVAACNAASFALDGALAAWWRLADGTGEDLAWTGAGVLTDADGDLIADPIADGAWSATLTLVDGDQVSAPGSFASPVP